MTTLTVAQWLAELFTGAALYIVLVEQPARVGSRSSLAVAQFRASLPRAERMQPALLISALLAASYAYWQQPSALRLTAILLLSSIVPLTFVFVLPINRRLLSGQEEDHVAHGMQLVQRWGRLHTLRTVLALAGSFLLSM
jgi:hypothetical protein